MYQQKFKTMMWRVMLFICSLLIINPGSTRAQSSENYKLIKSSINQGGDHSKSENSELKDVIGQSSAPGTASSENYSESSGFFYGNQLTTSVLDEPNTILLPEKFLLLQNYPNPFNPETRIEFHLPKAAEVELVIYNVNGNRVRQLVKGSISEGFNSVIWDGKNDTGMTVASGIYFYRITINTNEIQENSYTDIKKMILMK